MASLVSHDGSDTISACMIALQYRLSQASLYSLPYFSKPNILLKREIRQEISQIEADDAAVVEIMEKARKQILSSSRTGRDEAA